MKQARALREMGRVAAATWEPPLLQGRVREGETEFRSGLRILSKTNVENLCTCRQSRQHGAICAHSVAIGLEILRPSAPAIALPKPPETRNREPRTNNQELPNFSLTTGTPAELHIILPPNFAAAWEKGQLTIAFEATVSGKRQLLAALDRRTEYQVSENDLRLIETLRTLTNGELPGVAGLTRGPMLRLLGALTGHQRVTFGKSSPVAILDESLSPPLQIEETSTRGLKLTATLPKDARLLRTDAEQAWLLAGATFRPIAAGLPAAYGQLLEREILIPAEAAPTFLRRELPTLRPFFVLENFDFPEDGDQPETGNPQPDIPARFRLELEGSLNHLTARLQADNADQALVAGPAALDRLRRSGFTGPDSQGQLVLKGEQRILAFFARDLPRWEREADVTIGERFEHVTAGIERIQPRLEIRGSGESWFDLHVELGTSGGDRFSGAEIQRLLQSGQTYVRTRAGKTAVFDPAMLDELQKTLRDLRRPAAPAGLLPRGAAPGRLPASDRGRAGDGAEIAPPVAQRHQRPARAGRAPRQRPRRARNRPPPVPKTGRELDVSAHPQRPRRHPRR